MKGIRFTFLFVSMLFVVIVTGVLGSILSKTNSGAGDPVHMSAVSGLTPTRTGELGETSSPGESEEIRSDFSLVNEFLSSADSDRHQPFLTRKIEFEIKAHDPSPSFVTGFTVCVKERGTGIPVATGNWLNGCMQTNGSHFAKELEIPASLRAWLVVTITVSTNDPVFPDVDFRANYDFTDPQSPTKQLTRVVRDYYFQSLEVTSQQRDSAVAGSAATPAPGSLEIFSKDRDGSELKIGTVFATSFVNGVVKFSFPVDSKFSDYPSLIEIRARRDYEQKKTLSLSTSGGSEKITFLFETNVVQAILLNIAVHLNQFEGNCFNENERIKLGNLTAFRHTLTTQINRIIVGPEGARLVAARPNAKAYHQRLPSGVRWIPDTANLVFPFDPREIPASASGNDARKTLYHETTHHAEMIINRLQPTRPESERNTDYQDAVVDNLAKLVSLESNVRGSGANVVDFVPRWKPIETRFVDLDAGAAARPFVHDDNLITLTGFAVSIQEIKQHYLSGSCGDELRDLVRLSDALPEYKPDLVFTGQDKVQLGSSAPIEATLENTALATVDVDRSLVPTLLWEISPGDVRKTPYGKAFDFKPIEAKEYSIPVKMTVTLDGKTYVIGRGTFSLDLRLDLQLNISGPPSARVKESVTFTSTVSGRTPRLPAGAKLIWSVNGVKAGEGQTLTISREQVGTYTVKLEAKPEEPGQLIIWAETSTTLVITAETTTPTPVPSPEKYGKVEILAPAEVTAAEKFTVRAKLPPDLAAAAKSFNWYSSADLINWEGDRWHTSGPEAVMMFGPKVGRASSQTFDPNQKISLSALDAQKREIGRAEITIKLKPIALQASAMSSWDWSADTAGIHLKRKPASKKAKCGDRDCTSTIAANIDITWCQSCPANAEELKKTVESIHGGFLHTQNYRVTPGKEESLTIAGYSGTFANKTPQNYVEGNSEGLVDLAFPAVTSFVGGVVMKDGVAICFKGTAWGSGTRLGESGHFWFDDSPFVNQQGKAAYSEMIDILNSVTLGLDANVKQLPYKGPALDGSDLPRLKLVLSPNLKKLKKGDVVNVQAVVENDQNTEKPLKFEWTGDHAGSGASVQFLATKPGKQTLAVNVTDVGSAAVEFEVEDFKAQIMQVSPVGAKIMVGAPATFSAQLLSGGQPLSGNYVYRWQPTPDVKFEPAEGPANQVKAVFSRPGRQKVFVQVLEKKGEILQTIAESDQIEIEVIKPDFRITFDPQSIQVGKEVKAVIQLQPADINDIDFRWELTPNGKLLRESQDKREITFAPQDTKPIIVTARARVPFTGDDLGTRTATITATKVDVKVSVLGAEGPKPQVWKEGVGLVSLETGIAVHQFVGLRADVTPLQEGLRYEWSLNDDSHFAGNNLSQLIRVSRSQTGTGEATVIVRDKNGIELGRAAGTFDITVSQVDIDNGKKRASAAEMTAQAKALVAKGKLDEGIGLTDEAAGLDPKNAEAATLANKWKSDRSTIENNLSQMRSLMDQKKFADAAKSLGAAKQLHPKYAPVVNAENELASRSAKDDSGKRERDTQVKLGDDLYDKANYPAAIDAYNKALAIDPGSAAAYAGRCLAKRGSGDTSAPADCDKALQLEPNNADAFRGRSMIKRGNNDFPGAVADATRSIELEPGNYRSYLTRGLAREGLKDLNGATADYDRSIQLNPAYAMSFYYRGNIKLSLNDNAGAIGDLNQAIQLNPNYAMSYYKRGIAKSNLKDHAGALDDYSRSIQLDPKYNVAYYSRGTAKLNLNDNRGAIADLDQFLATNSKSSNGFNNRGLAYEKLGNRDRAISDYETALSLDPKNPIAKANLARIKGANSETVERPPEPSTKFDLGRVWRVRQWIGNESWTWVWTRRGNTNTFDAVARRNSDGFESRHVITFETLEGNKVTLSRPDAYGNYIGTLSADRKTVKGTTTFAGNTNEGWTAEIDGQTSNPDGNDGGGRNSNLALKRPAKQSSTSRYSTENDAQGAVDGITGVDYDFHTEIESNPWWQVDLGSVKPLSEIRIFNRKGCCWERAATIQILLSNDGINWDRVYSHPGTVFGADGTPLRVTTKGLSARFVRLQLAETNYLHLGEIEVYGTESTGTVTPRTVKPNLAGVWYDYSAWTNNAGLVCHIEQNGDNLVFINNSNDRSKGAFPDNSSVVAYDWQGGLKAKLENDGKRIVWSNGSVWERNPRTQAGTDRLGSEWSVTEGAGFQGRWVRRGKTNVWDAKWSNGAAAELTITISGDKVKVVRKDVGGVSNCTATYEGTLAPDNTIRGSEKANCGGGDFVQKWEGRIGPAKVVNPTPS